MFKNLDTNDIDIIIDAMETVEFKSGDTIIK
jgi:hypothetical protein